MAENAALTLIPDDAEAWVLLASEVDKISDHMPTSINDDLEELGWGQAGLIDAPKGIPITPSIEVKPFNAFGRPRYRVKLKNGTLVTGFTCLEKNETTDKFILPGSKKKRIGIPRNIQVYVLYRWIDEDYDVSHKMWVQLTPAPAEVSATSGIVDGEQWWAEIKIHHTSDANGDVFEIVDAETDDVAKTFTIAAATTSYTVTVGGATTSPAISAKTASALETALRALAPVQALPEPGVTVSGPNGGPLVATFTGPVTGVSATGSGGAVNVS